MPHAAQLTELEAQGWTAAEAQETYEPWDMGVWNHRWLLATGSCNLCGSERLGVLSAQLLLCLPCLDQYPAVSWHPTGGVRPKTPDLLTHALTCQKHSTTE